MPHFLFLIAPLLFSFLATFCVMPWLLRLCQRRGLYDQPDARKVHTARIPRLGGLLFAPSILVAMGGGTLVLQLIFPQQEAITIRFSTVVIMTGLLINYLVGILDDIFGVRASVKFIVQLLTSLLFPLCGLYINDLHGLFGIGAIPVWIGYPLTVFACLLIVNAYNLIDGIDGLSSSLGIMALAVFGILFWQLQVVAYTFLAVSLIGSILAFLYFNLWGSVERGTKTFMGDTGSLVLGYTLAYLAFKYAMDNPTVLSYRPEAFSTALSLVAVPIFDLIRVAVARWRRGVGIFTPDRTHLHHLCLDAGFSMRQSLLLILLLQGIILVGSCLALHRTPLHPTWVLLSSILLFALFVGWLKMRQKRRAVQ